MSVRKDVLGEKGILGHFRIQGIHQLLLCHALDRYTAVLHKLGDVPLDIALASAALPSDSSSLC
jgi:hypothetical protein